VTRFLLRSYAFPDEVERVAVQAEADGWDGLLFQDSQNLTPDVTVAMTLAARATERLLVGTAVTNLVTRNPAVVASMFATLQHLSGGRALLGVARGDTALHLVGEEAPTLEEYVELLARVRGYLAGQDVAIGDVSSRLQWLPDSDVQPVPVNVFGSGPRNLQAAAAHGDLVTMTVGAEPDQVRWGIDQVRAVSADIPLGALVVAAVGTRLPALRELVRANASISAHFRRDATSVLAPEDAAVVGEVTRDYSDARRLPRPVLRHRATRSLHPAAARARGPRARPPRRRRSGPRHRPRGAPGVRATARPGGPARPAHLTAVSLPVRHKHNPE
jgi:5,10-methylenetetrahydromethanopterin reductase